MSDQRRIHTPAMALVNIRCSRVLVDHQPCSYRGGHTSWTCRECGAVVYAPAIGADYRVLHGAAAVR
jgi:RNase P subunit RPR2